MKAHQAEYPIATQCRVLGVSTSGYYAWLKRAPSARSKANAELLEEIKKSHKKSDGTYGAPRIHADLPKEMGASLNRVARVMCDVGIQGVTRRKWTKTTVRDEDERAAPDLVDRDFTATGPDQLWVADITYIPTWAGFLYLAVVMDVWSRRIVGWAMATHLRTELVLDALNMALRQRRPEAVVHHSDQGSQYTSVAFGGRCKQAGVRPSMGSVGDCYDNAMSESFFATLECELIDRYRFKTQAEARMAVFGFIEGWYNPRRRHSSLGYESPISFEENHANRSAACPKLLEPVGDQVGFGAPRSLITHPQHHEPLIIGAHGVHRVTVTGLVVSHRKQHLLRCLLATNLLQDVTSSSVLVRHRGDVLTVPPERPRRRSGLLALLRHHLPYRVARKRYRQLPRPIRLHHELLIPTPDIFVVLLPFRSRTRRVQASGGETASILRESRRQSCLRKPPCAPSSSSRGTPPQHDGPWVPHQASNP